MWVSVLPCAFSFKSSFTFSPVHVVCGYTWEKSEQGVPGRSLQCYASRLRFHLDQRHRGRTFTQPLNAMFLWAFPWKPHTVAAAQNTLRNRGSHFFLLVPHLGSINSWGSRESCNERMRAVSSEGKWRYFTARKITAHKSNGTRGGHYGCMSVSMESKKIKTTKDHILNSKILQSLEQQEEKKSRHPLDN